MTQFVQQACKQGSKGAASYCSDVDGPRSDGCLDMLTATSLSCVFEDAWHDMLMPSEDLNKRNIFAAVFVCITRACCSKLLGFMLLRQLVVLRWRAAGYSGGLGSCDSGREVDLLMCKLWQRVTVC